MKLLVVLASLGIWIVTTAAVEASEFIPLGFIDNDPTKGSLPWDVSDDGKVVVGGGAGPGFVWREGEGIGVLKGASSHFAAYGVSADGHVIVGDMGIGPVGFDPGFIHTEGEGFAPFPGDLYGGAVSADGRVVVGYDEYRIDILLHREAIRWTVDGGVERLGYLGAFQDGNFVSYARDVSDDGTVIVGSSSNSHSASGYEQAFRWTEDEGMVAIGPAGDQNSQAWAVTPDGSIIGGSVAFTPRGPSQATLWSATGEMIPLGFLPGYEEGSIVSDISADGRTAVGSSNTTDPDNPNGTPLFSAFIWTEQDGMQSLRDALTTNYGLGESLEGWHLRTAKAISADGTVIVGQGFNPDGYQEPFLVRLERDLPGDYNGNGTVEQADLDLVLLYWGADTAAAPASWINHLPSGTIDQDELDGVLLNWGDTSVAAATAAAVPEPNTALLLLIGSTVIVCLRPRR